MKVDYRDRIPSKHSPLVQAREFAEKLESFEDYYYLLGIKIEGGENGIYEMLVQAVKNSR